MVSKAEEFKILKAMTDVIVRSSEETVKNKFNCVNEYVTQKGSIVGFGLLLKPEVAVQDMFATCGAETQVHTHEVKEWMILYSGRYRVTVQMEEGELVKELVPGCSIYIEPGQKHKGLALEDSWLLAVTIPADRSFPNAR